MTHEPTKAELKEALRLAIREMVEHGHCSYGREVCGRFAYCACPKCVDSNSKNFISKAQAKNKGAI